MSEQYGSPNAVFVMRGISTIVWALDMSYYASEVDAMAVVSRWTMDVEVVLRFKVSEL